MLGILETAVYQSNKWLVGEATDTTVASSLSQTKASVPMKSEIPMRCLAYSRTGMATKTNVFVKFTM